MTKDEFYCNEQWFSVGDNVRLEHVTDGTILGQIWRDRRCKVPYYVLTREHKKYFVISEDLLFHVNDKRLLVDLNTIIIVDTPLFVTALKKKGYITGKEKVFNSLQFDPNDILGKKVLVFSGMNLPFWALKSASCITYLGLILEPSDVLPDTPEDVSLDDLSRWMTNPEVYELKRTK